MMTNSNVQIIGTNIEEIMSGIIEQIEPDFVDLDMIFNLNGKEFTIQSGQYCLKKDAKAFVELRKAKNAGSVEAFNDWLKRFNTFEDETFNAIGVSDGTHRLLCLFKDEFRVEMAFTI